MKKLFFLVVAAILGLGSTASAANSYGLPDKIQDGNILHCFDWKFTDIQAMLPQIAEAGFGAVQVSPVQGNAKTNAEWYFAYMPYDFKIVDSGTGPNGNGTKAQLTNLCKEAEKYGIKIVVDVVCNHINKASSNHDTWWDSNGRIRWNGGINYGDRYSITHGQLGEYGDVNSESAEVQQRAKAFMDELKSCGVKGIRWDAAKHIGLPSESCNFWPAVCNNSGLWHYGEILDGPGGDANKLMKEYTTYMSVTDNGYCNNVRGAVTGGNVPSSAGGWAQGTISADKVVYWAESHDDYSNEWKASTNIPQDKIDRTWAIVSCRAGAAGLYFSRPSATERNAIKMGQKGSTHFTSKEIAAINHLRNAAVGTKDYYSTSNGVACITREGVGAAIIVGAGGSRQVSVSNGGGYVPAGNYVDEVSGNTFTVTNSTISGQVGSTGIAVIYGAPVKKPSVSFTPAGGSFRAETLSVTATLVNATSGWYKIDNGAQTSFTGSKTFTIGQGVDYGKTITVSWSATGAEGTQTGSVTYTKQDPNAAVYVYYNNPKNWGTVNAYIYKDGAGEVAAWPGSPMSKDATNYWKIEVPEAFWNGNIIFNNGSDQYPAAQQPGLPIGGKTMICLNDSEWKEYDGSNGGNGGGQTDPTPGGYYIYFDNSDNWATTPHIWAWNASGNCVSGSWPGPAMNLVSGSTWTYTFTDAPTGIIITNGSQQKAGGGDLQFVNGATYKSDGSYTTGGNGGGDTPSPNPDPEPNPNPNPDPVPTPAGTNLITDYYKVNPNGQVGTNKTVNVTCNQMKSPSALSNWTANDLIAQGVARDICQAFKGVHERPVVDSYALYAAYDNSYLYLGVQYVYTVWDEYGEGFQAGESKPYNMDGDLMIVFDLDPKKSWDGTLVNGNSVWKDKAYTTFANGIDCMWHGSTKPGVGTPGLFFPNATGKADYNDPNSCKKSNVVYGYADGVLPSITAIYGQKDFNYDPELLKGNTGFIDLKSEVSRLGGNDAAHTFYEFKFPLADLGITKAYIQQQGIGVMIVDMYGASAHSTLPYDPSMFDNVNKAYSMDPSSSAEKEDQDVVTYGLARIGRLAQSGVENVAVETEAKVEVSAGQIVITGAEGANVIVAGLDGRVRYCGVANDDITLAVNPGLYIVNVDGNSVKVLVK